MDPASKGSLKILGVVALVAIVGVSAYSMMRNNSLDQSGKVINDEVSSNVGENTVPKATIVKGDSSGGSIEYKDGDKSWHPIGNINAFSTAVSAFHEDGNFIYVGMGNSIKRVDKNTINNADQFIQLVSLPVGKIVTDLEVYDGNLFITSTSTATGIQPSTFSKLDLSPLGTQLQNIPLSQGAIIASLTEFNNKLYVGGDFTAIGNTQVAANDIAYWDGVNWHATNGYQGFQGIVSDLATYKVDKLFAVTGDSTIQANTGYVYPNSDPSTTFGCMSPIGDCSELIHFNKKMYVLARKSGPGDFIAYDLKRWDEASSGNSGHWNTLFEIPMMGYLSSGEDRRIITADGNNIYIANVSSDGVPVVVRWPGTGTTLYMLGEGLQAGPIDDSDNLDGTELFTGIHAPNNDHLYVSGNFKKSGTDYTVSFFADYSVDGV